MYSLGTWYAAVWASNSWDSWSHLLVASYSKWVYSNNNSIYYYYASLMYVYCIRMYVCMYIHKYISSNSVHVVWMFVCICVCVWVCVCTCMHTSKSTCQCMYICNYVLPKQCISSTYVRTYIRTYKVQVINIATACTQTILLYIRTSACTFCSSSSKL